MRKALSGADLAKGVCLAQLAIAGTVALVAALVWGRPQAIAALYGGAVALVPTAYFALRVFRRRADETPDEIVGAIFRGEIGKFALTGDMKTCAAMPLQFSSWKMTRGDTLTG